LRTENGVKFGDTVDQMDFPYLAKVTRLNIATLAAVAAAPMPPAPKVEAALQTYTDIKWQPVPGARSYVVWQRRTDASEWEAKPVLTGLTTTNTRLNGVRGDDWLFGVSAIGAGGAQSPIASAVPGGAFVPLSE
jgi:hypothetical protein